MKIAALLSEDGRIATGRNHGEAFGKLTISEQEHELISGFIDSDTGKFFTEGEEIYIKQIICMRHADVDESEDPSLTEVGCLRAKQTADFIFRQIHDIKQFEFFSSPSKRCVQTSQCLESINSKCYKVSEDFLDKKNDESIARFLFRIKKVLNVLPEKSFIVSHCNFIINLAQLVSNADVTQHQEWTNCLPKASLTYVVGHQIKWIGKKYENNPEERPSHYS